MADPKGGKSTTCQKTDWFFESLFKARAMLSPFLHISFAITFTGVSKRAGNQEGAEEQLSLLCMVCPRRGRSNVLAGSGSLKHFEPVHQSPSQACGCV